MFPLRTFSYGGGYSAGPHHAAAAFLAGACQAVACAYEQGNDAGDAGVDIWSAAAQGNVAPNPVHLDEPARIAAMAVSPAGATAVVWVVDQAYPDVRATVFQPGASTMSDVITVIGTINYGGTLSVAFVDGGFLIAVATTAGISVARLRADGSADGEQHIVTGPSTEFASLAPAGTSARIVSGDLSSQSGPILRWATLDSSTLTLSGATTIGGPDVFKPAPAVGLGNDTLVLLGRERLGLPIEEGVTDYLELARLDARGAPVGNALRIAADPQGARAWALALRGSEAIVAWISGGCPSAIDLARVVP